MFDPADKSTWPHEPYERLRRTLCPVHLKRTIEPDEIIAWAIETARDGGMDITAPAFRDGLALGLAIATDASVMGTAEGQHSAGATGRIIRHLIKQAVASLANIESVVIDGDPDERQVRDCVAFELPCPCGGSYWQCWPPDAPPFGLVCMQCDQPQPFIESLKIVAERAIGVSIPRDAEKLAQQPEPVRWAVRYLQGLSADGQQHAKPELN